MNKTWTLLTAILALACAGIIAGVLLFCSAGGGSSQPIALQVSSRTLAVDQDLEIIIYNRSGQTAFVPRDWQGLAIYRRDAQGYWDEYHLPDIFQPMHSSAAGEIRYSIPAGTLPPGQYKIIAQGWLGNEYVNFTLEANVEILTYRYLAVDLSQDGSYLQVEIHNNRLQPITLVGDGLGLWLEWRGQDGWEPVTLPDHPAVLEPGGVLTFKVPSARPGRYRLTVTGQDSEGNSVRGEKELDIML